MIKRMTRVIVFLIVLTGLPLQALAQPLICEGANPYWSLEIDTKNATAEFHWVGEFEATAEIELSAKGLGDPDKQAHSLVNYQTGFSGIAITALDACWLGATADYTHRVELLTQKGREAVLLSGCCRVMQGE